MVPYYDEDILVAIVSALFSLVPSLLLGIVSYVLTALAVYTIARRRGLNRPWLAWIPVVGCWVVGSLSDQYQYVVKGQNRSKRKSLLTLSIISTALTVAVLVQLVVVIGQVILAVTGHRDAEYMLQMVLGPLMGIEGALLILLGVTIAYAIIYYMALYDVYKSLDPSNCVLFLVLSILISVTAPFFLFFNRNKDLGMPPRKREPSAIPQQIPPQPAAQQPPQNPEPPQPPQPPKEPWEREDNNKDYL